jgi:hypothetical protein
MLNRSTDEITSSFSLKKNLILKGAQRPICVTEKKQRIHNF